MVRLEEGFLKPTEHLRNLQLLEEVAKDSNISQRKLSSSLGVALGVTNACLKKMIRKGHIKVKGINHKRIAYYLTPEGFTEKTRLTYHFLQHTVSYYKNLKQKVTSKLEEISKTGAKRILFYGAGEVMEVAYICLQETNLELVGIIDDSLDKDILVDMLPVLVCSISDSSSLTLLAPKSPNVPCAIIKINIKIITRRR